MPPDPQPQTPTPSASTSSRPATWQDIISAEAAKQGVDPRLALAVAQTESSFDPTTRSPRGAIGLMQLMPETAKRWQVDPADPVQNIRGGVSELKQLLANNHGNVVAALRLYNASPGASATVTDPYVQRVLGNLATYRSLKPPANAAVKPTVGQPPPSQAHIGPAPSPFFSISRDVLRGTGMVLGGFGGGTLGAGAGPVGAGVGAVAGAGAGATVGEGAEQLLEAGARRFGIGTPPPAPTTNQAITRLGLASQEGMTSEAVGGAAGAVVTKATQPFANKLEPYAREALQTFTDASGRTHVLPSEISTSRGLNVAENVAEGSLLGGSNVTAVKQARQQLAEQRALGILNDLGGSTTTHETGEALQASRNQGVQTFRAGERWVWSAFQQHAASIPVETPTLDAFVQKIAGQAHVVPSSGVAAAKRIAALAQAGDQESAIVGGVRGPISDMPASLRAAVLSVQPEAGPTSAADFQQTISDLGRLTRQLEQAAQRDPSKNSDYGLVKQLYQRARGDLETSLVKGSPEAQAAYQEATAFSREGNDRLFNKTVRAMATKAPEKIVPMLLKPNNSTAIRAVERAVDPAAFQQVRQAAMEQLLQPDAKTGQIAWGDVLSRLQHLGPNTTEALFPGGHAAQIQRVANLMLQLERKPAGAIGKFAIQFGQMGAAVSAATGHFTPESSAILLTPVMLAKIFSSQRGLKLLSTGLEAGPGTKAALNASAALATFLGIDRQQGQQDRASRVGQPPPSGSHIGQPPPG